MDYKRIYTDAGNIVGPDGAIHIPIFTCGTAFGHTYARSVSYGLSILFSLKNNNEEQVAEQVFSYLLDVCAKNVENEDSHVIYEMALRALAAGEASIFALSYKHQMRGGIYGERQRLSRQSMRNMSSEIVSHARSSNRTKFCFWLDQILGQRQPYSERRWVDNGLLPYSVFDTIVFDYSPDELGAWLLTERLLASGRSSNTSRQARSTLIRRGLYDGGPDSLMRAASAIAAGAIDELRGLLEDKLTIVNWALETLDMSQFLRGNQIEHFTRLFHKREPWNMERLSSVMFNLEILEGEVCRDSTERGGTCWVHEAELLSFLIPNDLKRYCDGTWLSSGVTVVYTTNCPDLFVYLKTVMRGARDQLVIVALVTQSENRASNHLQRYMATSCDILSDAQALKIIEKGLDLTTWGPVARFLRDNHVEPLVAINKFDGKWLCNS